MSRFFCSDCTILRIFSELLGRFGLPDHLPFSKPKVNWLLHPVMVLFLSSHSFGTIIAYPYIPTERLLPVRTFSSRTTYSFFFLKAAGLTPSCRLKNVPKWLWFWNPNSSAIS